MNWTKSSFILALILLILVGTNLFVASQVMKVSGLAVAQSSTHWNHVCDGVAVGDGLTDCTIAASMFGFNGVGADRLLSTQANGLDVDVTRQPATEGATTPSDAFANPSNAVTTWSLGALWDSVASQWERRASAANVQNAGVDITTVPGIGLTQLLGRGHLTTGEETVSKIGASGHGLIVHPMQSGGVNLRAVSAADTEVTITRAAAANNTRVVHKVSAFCDAGTATLTIESPSATVVWESAPGEVGTTSFSIDFIPGFKASAENQAIVARLTSCGAGNVGTVMGQFGGIGS